MKNVVRIGLDIAKSVFQVHGVDAQGKVVLRKSLSRGEMLAFFAQSACVPDRHRSLRRLAPLGARIEQTRS